MDTALTHKFPFILDRNLAKANCTGNRVCTSCDIVASPCQRVIFDHVLKITWNFLPVSHTSLDLFYDLFYF